MKLVSNTGALSKGSGFEEASRSFRGSGKSQRVGLSEKSNTMRDRSISLREGSPKAWQYQTLAGHWIEHLVENGA